MSLYTVVFFTGSYLSTCFFCLFRSFPYKDENHVDDQEYDITNNSKEEEEKTVQNPPIENHDNSRNTEAMEGKLEQSQSILGQQTKRPGVMPPISGLKT
jgi:hypothetical protein